MGNEVWKDDLSKKVFDAVIKSRETSKYEMASIRNPPGQLYEYFPNEITSLLGREEVFIDAGAYNGDTIKIFIHWVAGYFRKIIGFEPDPINFKKVIESKVMLIPNVIVENMGIYDNSEIINFSTKDVASQIDILGNEIVRVVSIDDYMNGDKATYIKMDIEGAEEKGLIGASETICKFHPKLAICVYHKPQDIYEIPELIKSMVPEYNLYLRHHSYDMASTVCYAVI